jgi:hypothetical protein
MVRKGSSVRVRQRALTEESPANGQIFVMVVMCLTAVNWSQIRVLARFCGRIRPRGAWGRFSVRNFHRDGAARPAVQPCRGQPGGDIVTSRAQWEAQEGPSLVVCPKSPRPGVCAWLRSC